MFCSIIVSYANKLFVGFLSPHGDVSEIIQRSPRLPRQTGLRPWCRHRPVRLRKKICNDFHQESVRHVARHISVVDSTQHWSKRNGRNVQSFLHTPRLKLKRQIYHSLPHSVCSALLSQKFTSQVKQQNQLRHLVVVEWYNSNCYVLQGISRVVAQKNWQLHLIYFVQNNVSLFF